MKNCVYFFFDRFDNLLYIGKAKDLKQRILSHNHLPYECYIRIYGICYIEFDTEFDAETMEKLWIAKYKPVYNTVYSTKDSGLNIYPKDFEMKLLFSWKYYFYKDKDEFSVYFESFIIKKILSKKRTITSSSVFLDMCTLFYEQPSRKESMYVVDLFSKMYGCNYKDSANMYINQYILYVVDDMIKNKNFNEENLEQCASEFVYQCSFFDGARKEINDYLIEHINFAIYVLEVDKDIDDIEKAFEEMPDEYFEIFGSLYNKWIDKIKYMILLEYSKKTTKLLAA